MHALFATTHGNGPFIPVAIYRGVAYRVAPPLEDIQEALEVAIQVVQGIRDGMRCPGYDEMLARLS